MTINRINDDTLKTIDRELGRELGHEMKYVGLYHDAYECVHCGASVSAQLAGSRRGVDFIDALYDLGKCVRKLYQKLSPSSPWFVYETKGYRYAVVKQKQAALA